MRGARGGFENDKSPIYVGIIVIGHTYYICMYIYVCVLGITRFKLSPNKNSNIDINILYDHIIIIIMYFRAWWEVYYY